MNISFENETLKIRDHNICISDVKGYRAFYSTFMWNYSGTGFLYYAPSIEIFMKKGKAMYLSDRSEKGPCKINEVEMFLKSWKVRVVPFSRNDVLCFIGLNAHGILTKYALKDSHYKDIYFVSIFILIILLNFLITCLSRYWLVIWKEK